MEHRKLAFIGAGNMSRSLISGLIQSGYPADHIIAANPSRPKLDALAADFGICTTQNNLEAIEQAEAVVLAVKPQMMAAMLGEQLAAGARFDGKLLISIAAGISVARLEQMAGGHSNLVRTMPNTPSLLGLGMTGLYARPHVAQADRDYCQHMMEAVGQALWVAEEDGINQVIAAAGSAPAYFFLFMEAMAKEAERNGFSADEARLLVQQTALGAANMVAANPQLSLGQLREQVTSKGGTTAEAIRSFNDNGLDRLVADAMAAAVARARELESQL
ncbi:MULTISPECIES: pyrroline-5-carboxylate reductase [Oceanimonas]|uniref:Pyrroline-5-carboxylate reductase n=1 Tax=Oceanimonas doudoroffii TaxID=84158 RepID=A0A233RJP3_9GAMM|nr:MULTISPECIES: pyrroline-5-carboxylate reductase [Oceanimonas]NHH99792.1 Pyrroline-5-carboxylate reductase [Oceanimonas sp. MB9]OXY83613.1 pyrroline-5-carboxylate reductase [Oceanimonas doudoroffii]